MSDLSYTKNRQQLAHLMQQVGVANTKELSRIAGISQWQITRLEYGLILKIPVEALLKLAKTLQISLYDLLNQFSDQEVISSPELRPTADNPVDNTAELVALKQDYHKLQQERERELLSQTQEFQRLQQQLQQQRETLTTEFQRSSLETLESWLLQWPTAASAAQKNPKLPATKLLPLLKPMAALLKQWGVEAIACVGELVPYDPQYHELIEGQAESGERVKVRYVGYRQGDNLLYRAKVSSIETAPTQEKAQTPITLEDTDDSKSPNSPTTALDVPQSPTTVLDVSEDAVTNFDAPQSPTTVLDVSEDAAVDEETAKNIIS